MMLFLFSLFIFFVKKLDVYSCFDDSDVKDNDDAAVLQTPLMHAERNEVHPKAAKACDAKTRVDLEEDVICDILDHFNHPTQLHCLSSIAPSARSQ